MRSDCCTLCRMTEVVFDHEKLDVYQLATEFADTAEEVAQSLQAGNAHIPRTGCMSREARTAGATSPRSAQTRRRFGRQQHC